MKFYFNLIGLALSAMLSTMVHAETCVNTLMGEDCQKSEKGVSSHMRGNAVENAKASKALKAAKRKAQKEATSMSAAKHQHKK